jgi:hypothetical protein
MYPFIVVYKLEWCTVVDLGLGYRYRVYGGRFRGGVQRVYGGRFRGGVVDSEDLHVL